jgi:suppressor of G2 allele of SKP1
MEVTLAKKVAGNRWEALEAIAQVEVVKPAVPKQAKNWDKLAKDLVKEEEEKATGDAALNQLFQQIYRDANEDTRKAMMKSFQESAGTCLSTNWEEVFST